MVEQGTVVQVRPMLDQRIVGLYCTLQQGGGHTLEPRVVISMKCEAPCGACSVGADESVSGPVVFGQDAEQHFGVDVVSMTVLTEVNVIEMVA